MSIYEWTDLDHLSAASKSAPQGSGMENRSDQGPAKFHRPLLGVILFFLSGNIVAGIFLCEKVFSKSYAYFFMAVLFLSFSLAAFLLKLKKPFKVILCIFFFLLGAFRFLSDIAPREADVSSILGQNPRKITVCGVVKTFPEWKSGEFLPHLVFLIKAEKALVDAEEISLSGTMRVNLFSPDEAPEQGDRLVVGGKAVPPPAASNPGEGAYDVRMRREGTRAILNCRKGDLCVRIDSRKNICSGLQRAILKAREKCDGILDRYLDGEAFIFTRSIVLGLRDNLSEDRKNMFIRTGTMHILAVSGLHTAIVGGIVIGLFRVLKVPLKASYLLAILLIAVYAVFTGGCFSVLRAFLMFSMILLCKALDRDTDILNALALSAFFIVFFEPRGIFDRGFILSYLSLGSIICLTPITDAVLGVSRRAPGTGETEKRGIPRYLKKSVSVSFAAGIGMLPVIAAYFGIITPCMVLTNLVAILVLSVMLVLGYLLITAGFFDFLSTVSGTVSFFTEKITEYFFLIMDGMARVPFAFIQLSPPAAALVALFYVFLIIALVISRKNKGYGAFLIISVLFAGNIFVWNELAHGYPLSLRLTFFDVGKADASIAEFPDGGVMLIDTGSGGKYARKNAGRNVIAPYLREKGIRKIDCVIITHDHEDHIGGLPYLLDNFEVGAIIQSEVSDDLAVETSNDLYPELKQKIRGRKIPVLRVKRGDVIKGFKGALIQVLNPAGKDKGDANDSSLVLRLLTDRDHAALFCADAGDRPLAEIRDAGISMGSDIVKMPHHGAVRIRSSLIKNIIGNAAGNSSTIITAPDTTEIMPGLINMLEKYRVKVYVTGQTGAVIAKETDIGFDVQGFLGEK